MIGLLLLWATRLLVAAVFGWAGVTKLLDLPRTRRAVGEFGVPDRWVRAVAMALPVVELGVAAGVLLPWTVVAAGVVALGLLAVFSAMVAWLLWRGKRPACACFGAGSGVISGITLARNGLLGALVLVATVGANDALPVEYAVGTAVAVALGTVQLWQGLSLRRLRRPVDHGDGLPIGVPAPSIDLRYAAGGRGSLASALSAGLPVVLLFVHPGCSPCSRIVAELPRWRTRLSGKATILLIGRGAAESLAALDGEILVQHGTEVAEGYLVRGTPAAVLVDARGRIAAPLAVGTYAIRELLEATGPDAVRR
ncbi:hypothetical protein G7043_33290 [Lentzea sp. NEAU-D13]|uniref:Thioredoxin domain-containing protein n=1 Tax=Lentzea alba TaxID=2714351 RepID=A0A7C9RUK1_9PSEU|nr:MauE/DoxX family redox-associated membrane protein [Lentzea alba]NGY63805.1 hypothetical protein [Lentzea alba]